MFYINAYLNYITEYIAVEYTLFEFLTIIYVAHFDASFFVNDLLLRGH